MTVFTFCNRVADNFINGLCEIDIKVMIVIIIEDENSPKHF